MSPAEEAASVLRELGVDAGSGDLISNSPIDGGEIGHVRVGDADATTGAAMKAFEQWRAITSAGACPDVASVQLDVVPLT